MHSKALCADDPRSRTIEACELLARQYGVPDQLAELPHAERWEPVAVALLAEAVAALAIEVDPKRSTGHWPRRAGTD